MTPRRRLLLALGWALLVVGPLAGALFLARPVDETAVVYGTTPPSRALAAVEGAVPAAALAGVLFLVVVGRVRRSRGVLSPRDRSLVDASELAGWVLAGLGVLGLGLLVLLGGPLGIIGAFAAVIVGFSLIGRLRRRGG